MSVRQDVSNIRSLWPDVPRHARQSAGHPTCSRRTSECLGRLFRLSRNDRTCDGLSMCQSASSIEFLAATEGAAGYRQDVSQRRRGRQDTGKMSVRQDVSQARCQSGKMSVRQDVSQARCQSGKMSVRQDVSQAYVRLDNILIIYIQVFGPCCLLTSLAGPVWSQEACQACQKRRKQWRGATTKAKFEVVICQ